MSVKNVKITIANEHWKHSKEQITFAKNSEDTAALDRFF
jgi:hypothetical protein